MPAPIDELVVVVPVLALSLYQASAYGPVRTAVAGLAISVVMIFADLVHAVRVVASGQALVAPATTRRLLEQVVARPRPGARA